MNIQHSSKTDLWYTPPHILDKVRQVLGPIDLDPASDEIGNSAVKAKRFITKAENGLTSDWGFPRTIFINPPGGKLGNESLAALFWVRLMKQMKFPEFDHAIFLAFSLEQLQTTQGKGVPSIGEFPLCVPSKRLRFYTAQGTEGPAPSHSNLVVYVSGCIDNIHKFKKVFSDLGVVV